MNDLVDTHFHIWDFKKFQYDWPTDNEAAINRSIPIEELIEEMKPTPVKHAVFVQCLNDNPDEAKWVMELAKTNSFIKGVVAGVDMTNPKLEEILDDLQKNPLFKGIRHILDFEDEKWITRDEVHNGLGVLEKRGLTFDLLLRPPLLKYIPGVVSKFPKLKFMVDHLAKPYIKDKKIDGWKEEIEAVAKYPNVYCKLSGMVTENDLLSWKQEEFQPYVDHVIGCFGIDRCVFGSDWPVCKLAQASYADVFNLLNKLVPTLSDDDKLKLFRNNARDFYNLNL